VYKKDKTCFTRGALNRLAKAWNDTNPSSPIKNVHKLSKIDLWHAINAKMDNICKGDHKEACWVDNLEGMRPSKEVAKSLRPVKPSEWNANEYTWLTNFDIEAVMDQYDYDINKSYKYKFLGVYPIDFQAKTFFGKCLFEEFCAINVANYYRKGIHFIGLITNLDRHDQSGSHWTSLFVCINPQLPSFGAHYYDSVGSRPPSEIMHFVNTIQQQVLQIPGSDRVPFKFNINKNRHQRGNTECGVFSMDYQLRWIHALKENPKITFNKIVDIKLNDEEVHKLRNILYRPYQKKA
jgi:hypothetical protein